MTTASQKAHDTRLEAESLAAHYPPLLVEAERVANTVAQGLHGRRRVGPGETFWQFQHYTPGDPATSIDWRQSSKSEHLYVRQTEWEAASTVWIWCDPSPSMNYGSKFANGTKRDRAVLIALALSVLLLRAGERVASLDADVEPGSGRTALRALADAWLAPSPTPKADTSLPTGHILPRFAQTVLIGDFLTPIEEIEQKLVALASTGVQGHLLQILDPAEEDLPFEGRVDFVGPEDDLHLVVGRAQNLRERYQDRLRSHRTALAQLVGHMGWTFSTHRTAHRPETALLGLYGALAGDQGIV